MNRTLKLFAITSVLAVASFPAFASDHISIDPDLGLFLGVINWMYLEVIHLANHSQALFVAATTWNWQYFQSANLCANQAMLTSIFFTAPGVATILSMVTLYTLFRRRRALLLSIENTRSKRMHA
jgi:hypothetical protein